MDILSRNELESFVNVCDILTQALSKENAHAADQSVPTQEAFFAKRALFTRVSLNELATWEKDGLVSFAYGVVPYPKANEEQVDYYSTVAWQAPTASIPHNHPKLEAAAVVLNGLVCMGEDNILPAHIFRISMSQSTESLIDMTRQALVADHVSVWKLNQASQELYNVIWNDRGGIVSTYESYKNILKASLQEINTAFGIEN